MLAHTDEYCHICKMRIPGELFLFKDEYHGNSHVICKACSLVVGRCTVCGLPTPDNIGLHLPDGRAYCAEDSKLAIMDDEAAAAQFAKARQEVSDFLAPYPPLAQRNVEIHLVTREQFNAQYRRTPGIDDPSRLLGLTISRWTDDGKLNHQIYLLHGVPQEEFLAVCAHEYAHTWLNEREQKKRQLHKDTAEGFCEFVAYKMMSKLGLEREKQRILESTYTRGQVNALVAAEDQYNFHRVVRWITEGVDSWLESEQLPRLLVLREKQEEGPSSFSLPAGPPSKVPDKLVLKGLSGTARRPFALINNATLSEKEETQVRVGTTNVLVRCLTIGSNSVTIQVRGEPSPRQLRLEMK